MVREATERLLGEIREDIGVMQGRVNGLEAHLTDRIDSLGGLEAESVREQLAEMRDNFG